MSRWWQINFTFSWIMVWQWCIWDTSLCLHKNIPLHWFTSIVHWVRCPNVSWQMPGKLTFFSFLYISISIYINVMYYLCMSEWKRNKMKLIQSCRVFFVYLIFLVYRSTVLQSQPCHWRNIKSVTKRDVSNATSVTGLNNKKEKSVSDNISLFQSLRVLQEGEEEEPYSSSARSKWFLVKNRMERKKYRKPKTEKKKPKPKQKQSC